MPSHGFFKNILFRCFLFLFLFFFIHFIVVEFERNVFIEVFFDIIIRNFFFRFLFDFFHIRHYIFTFDL